MTLHPPHPWMAAAGLAALAALGPAAPALAAEASEREPRADAPGAATPPRAELEVRIGRAGLAVNEQAVRAAVLRELDRIAPPQRSAPAEPIRVSVTLDAERELTVVYQSETGSELRRTVTAPERPDEVPEAAALLVGNLARDEASGLLQTLQEPDEGEASRAPAPPPNPELEPAPVLAEGSINLSLFAPVTLLPDADQRRLHLELGLLYSHIGGLSGVAINLLGVSRVDGEGNGLQLGSLGYWHGGPGSGLRLGLVFGGGRERFEGGSLSAAVLVQQGEVAGFQISGAANIATGAMAGAQLSGAYNQSAEAAGLQAAGAANVALADVAGTQLGGAFNLARGDLAGAQLAGAVNVTTDDLDGVQISGAVNVADTLAGAQIGIVNVGSDVRGLQLGIVNVARDVEGVQLGIVNVARKVDGLSFGLVPYQSEGRTQAVAWYNSNQLFNLGVRFFSGPLYVMPTLGYQPDGARFAIEAGGASYAPGLSVGARLPLGPAFGDLDVNYSSPSNRFGYDEHNIDLRYRLLAGVQLWKRFGIFAGGGLRHHFRTQGPSERSVEPELSAGIQLL